MDKKWGQAGTVGTQGYIYCRAGTGSWESRLQPKGITSAGIAGILFGALPWVTCWRRHTEVSNRPD